MEDTIFANLPFDPIILIILLFVLIVVLFLLVFTVMSSQRKLLGHYRSFMRGKDGKSLEQSMLKCFSEMDQMTGILRKHEEKVDHVGGMFNTSYQKTGIVRYDAFQEMGGKLSFALCLLNDEDSGFILNVMHSGEGCFTYIKEIIKGESFMPLSEEEKLSLEKAMNVIEYLDD